MRFRKFYTIETSKLCLVVALSQSTYIRPSCQDSVVSIGAMGKQTGGAVLDPVGSIGKLPRAFVTQSVEGAIAEQAVEILGIGAGVAGKIFAVGITEETMTMVHSMLLLWRDKLLPVGGQRKVSMTRATASSPI